MMNDNLKASVRKTIEQFFHAMDTQDLDLMQSLLPKNPKMIHIGTNSDEIWQGYNSLWEATEIQFQHLEYYQASIYDLTINFSGSTQMAYYFHRLDAEIKSGVKVTHWKGARFTGVLQKRNDGWQMMQTHVSLPSDL